MRDKLNARDEMREKSKKRFLLIVAGVVLFSGLLMFSVLKVRFSVAAGEKSEFAIIKYSLTDSVQRGVDGNLTVSAVEKGKAGEPCPT